MNLGWAPREGWRTFAGEVGVIVLGVLIALGAQQAVDAWNRHQDRAFTEAALRDEIGVDAMMAFERLVIETCLRDRIAGLAAKIVATNDRWRADPLDVHSPTYRAFALPGAYRTPNRQWSRAAWNTAVESGVLNTMDRNRVAALASLYDQVAELQLVQESESQQAPQLTFLAYDLPLDPAARHAALSALAAVDSSNRRMVLLSQQFLDNLHALRLDFDVNTLGGPALNNARGPAEIVALQRANRGACARDLRLNL